MLFLEDSNGRLKSTTFSPLKIHVFIFFRLCLFI